MNRYRLAALISCVWFAANSAATGWGQESPAEDAEAPWRELYFKEAQTLQLFVVQGAEKHVLTLHAKPVMRWVTFGGMNGDVFVWLNEGRPEVVGNIVGFPAEGLKPNQRYTLAELHSLSTSTIEAAPVGGGQTWKTRSGIALSEIRNAPPPAKTERERKRQARQLARDFSGRLSHYGEKWNLRMLDKPLYEYGATSSEVLGGALFAFVAFRTDPEVLLLVEARKTADAPQWFYLPIRFSQQDLWLKHRDLQVWESLTGRDGGVNPKAEDSLYRVYDNKPLFEYSDPKTKMPWGAVFGMSSTGTNPAALLLIEARPGESGKLQWHYGLARMTVISVRATLNNVEIWSEPAGNNMESGRWTYFFLPRDFP